MSDPQLLQFQSWTFRLLMDRSNLDRLLVLIHGWMGDENSMWVLARNLSDRTTIIAPRAPIAVPEGGYSWREIQPGTWGRFSFADILPTIDSLMVFIDQWSASVGINAKQVDLMGFSQGAAMAFAITLLHPERVRRLVALSGFVPRNAEAFFKNQQLSGKPIFISHGRQDELILVEEARQAVKWFKETGAKVIYCESDSGHKVSKECLAELERFLGKD